MSPPEWRTNLIEFPDEEDIQEDMDPDTAQGPADPTPENLETGQRNQEQASSLAPSDGTKKGSKGFKRGILNLSKRIRSTATKVTHRIKDRDRNNNSGSQARFYVDLGAGPSGPSC